MEGASSRALARACGALAVAGLVLPIGACAALSGGSNEPDWGPDPERYRRMMAAQRARSFTPSELPDASDPSLRDSLHRGDRLRDAGQIQKALFAYLEAYRTDPRHPAPRVRIGYLHLREDPARAQSIFEEVLERTPDRADAQLGLGLALLSRDRVEDARTALERAVDLAPDSPAALSALAAACDRAGRHEDAQAALQRALEQSPEDPGLLNNLGVSYLLSRDLEEAEKVLRKAVFVRPGDARLHNNLGLALGLQGHYDEALSEFREAADEPTAQNNLGYVYFLNGRYDEARARYERALVSDGSDKLTVIENLRATRAATGQEPAARR